MPALYDFTTYLSSLQESEKIKNIPEHKNIDIFLVFMKIDLFR